MKSKIWLILLAITVVLLLEYSGKVTTGHFNDGENATDNVLRVKTSPILGSADSFVILAGSTVTNDGNTAVTGDLGLSPGTSVVGFPPGTVNGTRYEGDATAAQAKTDLTTAYNDAAARTPVTTVTGDTLGGLNLTPGVYGGGALSLTGSLTLTGDATAVWIFKAASTLDAAAGSQVNLSGSAKAANVYWVVGSSATLGADSIFKGNIMASASITLYASAALEGRALAQTGAVTLDTNTIIKPTP